jgi:diadenosine tetraphosphate (Ap4A) HIT family hydrolase
MPEEIADKTFFQPCGNAIHVTEEAILQASINPVTPFHILAFPHPDQTGGTRASNGTLQHMPKDGGMIDLPLIPVLCAFHALYEWTTQGFKSNPLQPEGLIPAKSVWTANMGRAAALAVPYLHIHHLPIYDDEGVYDAFRSIDANPDRFIRFFTGTPESILRKQFEAEYGTALVATLHNDKTMPRLEIDEGFIPAGIDFTRENTVKPNDFSLSLLIPPDRHVSAKDLTDMVSTAYGIQKEFKKQGAGGFTMMADVTILQCPQTLAEKRVLVCISPPIWTRRNTRKTCPAPKAGLFTLRKNNARLHLDGKKIKLNAPRNPDRYQRSHATS